ncbi:unnamed protein product [Chrysoparadoxa australica]
MHMLLALDEPVLHASCPDSTRLVACIVRAMTLKQRTVFMMGSELAGLALRHCVEQEGLCEAAGSGGDALLGKVEGKLLSLARSPPKSQKDNKERFLSSLRAVCYQRPEVLSRSLLLQALLTFGHVQAASKKELLVLLANCTSQLEAIAMDPPLTYQLLVSD